MRQQIVLMTDSSRSMKAESEKNLPDSERKDISSRAVALSEGIQEAMRRKELNRVADLKRQLAELILEQCKVSAKIIKINLNDADDMIQEGATRAWKSINKYEPNKGLFSNWIHTIVINVYINHYNKSNRRKRILDSNPIEIANSTLGREQLDNGICKTAEEIIERVDLKAKYNLKLENHEIIYAVRQYFWENKSIAEIASVLGTTEYHVKQALDAFIQELKNFYQDYLNW